MQEKLFANNNPELLDHAKKMRREMTAAEQRLWHYLRAGRLQGYKFRRQQPMGSYIADFVCVNPKLIIEADGGQHSDAPGDERRDTWLRSQGFTVLRFWNNEIMTNLEGVLSNIASVTSDFPLSPGPSPARGEG